MQSASIKPADLEEFKDDQSIIEDGKEKERVKDGRSCSPIDSRKEEVKG